jgi:hypothetical protein
MVSLTGSAPMVSGRGREPIRIAPNTHVGQIDVRIRTFVTLKYMR